MKLTVKTCCLLIAALLSARSVCSAQTDSLLVVFWNVENFFHWDSPYAQEYLTKSRFYTKCSAIAKTMGLIAAQEGRWPDIMCFAELEDGRVLRSIVSSTPLRKLGYSAVHYDSPDRRGIDCGLLYRRSSIELLISEPKHIHDSSGAVMATRDILLADFGSFAVLVNHHPSKIGGKSDRRDAAVARMNAVADSLLRAGCPGVIAVGDFNENFPLSPGEQGTLKYNGKWEKIDGHFIWGSISAREEVFCHPLLLEPDRAFGGIKPRRYFSGPRYLGGISDHLPIIVWIKPTELVISQD